MKKIFILIVVLMTHFAYTQDIKPTQKQEREIARIFTPKYIIESSKPISIVKELDSVLAVRDVQITELKAKIEALRKEHVETLINIATQSTIAETATREVDGINEDQLEKNRFKWEGLHSYIGVEVPDFSFERTTVNTELMYELEKIEFGIKVDLSPKAEIDAVKYEAGIFLKLRYKLF